jgi:hypothetical protein
LGKFWRALDWKMLIYFIVIRNILRMFGILYDHLVHFVFIRYIYLRPGVVVGYSVFIKTEEIFSYVAYVG